MIQRLLNSQSKTIVSAAFILGTASLISRLLGLLRDRILASQFGAGDELDIYYAAFRIPDFVYNIMILGAISAGFIPVFISYLKKEKSDKSALAPIWQLTNSLINIIGLILVSASLILFIFAPHLMKIITPGFSAEKLAIAASLTRIMFLSPIFLGLSAIIGGVLQSFKRFMAFSLSPIMYNLGIIFGALFLIEPFGLVGLAYGVVVGAFLHLAIQIPSAITCGWKWRLAFDLKIEGIKRIFKLMPGRTLSLALVQINFLLMTAIASFLAVGSISVYNLAYNIWSFPLGIFAASFAVAAFPKLSEEAQAKNKDGFVKTFSKSVRQILFFIIPATALLIILRAQIVRVAFGAGNFNWQDTILTLQTLAYFSIGLFAEALILLFLRGFFAYEDTWTPFLIGLLATIFRLISAWLLAARLGVVGLALAYSLGSIFYLFLLYLCLKKKIGNLDEKNIFIFSSKIISSSLIATIVVYLVLRPFSIIFNMTTGVGVFLQGGLAAIAGIIIYFVVCRFFKVNELTIFLTSFKRNLSWKKVLSE